MNTLTVRIYDCVPERRRQNGYLGHSVVFTTPTYGSLDFYHDAIAGRLRRAYRMLRRHGIDAAAAREAIAQTMFATHMSADTAYRVAS